MLLLHFAICLFLATMYDLAEGLSSLIRVPKIKQSYFHTESSHFSEEQNPREFRNGHYFVSRWNDQTNYPIYSALDSEKLDIVHEPNVNLMTYQEYPEYKITNSKNAREMQRRKLPKIDGINRKLGFTHHQKALLRNLFSKNRRESFDFGNQDSNDYYDDSLKHKLGISKMLKTDQNYLNRMADIKNQRKNERFQENDSASLMSSNKDYEENTRFSDELIQFKNKPKISVVDKEDTNPSENNMTRLLFRKTSRVEYLVKNDKGVFDLFSKEMPEDIDSLLRKFHVTANYDSEVHTEMIEMASNMSKNDDENGFPKYGYLNIPNESELKTENKLIPNESKQQSDSDLNDFNDKDIAAGQVKSEPANKFYPVPNEVTNENANKIPNNSNYEYEEEEDDQYETQSEKFNGVSSGEAESSQTKSKNLPSYESDKYGSDIQIKNDKEVSNSAALDYELAEPSIKPYIIPYQEELLVLKSTTTHHIVKQTYNVSTTIEDLTEVSTKNEKIHLVLNENEPLRNDPFQSDSYRTTTETYLETKPQLYRTGYDTRNPPVLPQQDNEVNEETDLKKVLMHIRPPHRTKAPQIRHRRKLRVASHSVAVDSPINQKVPLRRRRRQIDVDSVMIDHRTRNVADCCYNGGTCFTSHLPTHGVPPSRWCECPLTFAGRYCEEDVNECAIRTPCVKDHELCVNTHGGFSCVCQANFVREADDCIARVTCEEFPCLNGAKCFDVEDGSFVCDCPLGYVGRTCDTRVAECEDASCSKNEICISTETGFKCLKANEVESVNSTN